MKFIHSTIPDIIFIEPDIHGDERGFFMETYQANLFKQAGIEATFVQDNHSGSRQGILRGLHYQIRHTQGKLVRFVAGEVFDVAVDLRRSSEFYGKWVGTILSAQNKRQVWIPPGFAHGFYVLSEWAEIVYKATDYYAPEWERTLAWNDNQVAIEWPLIGGQPPFLSAKDARGIAFNALDLVE
jgi:dTDP-4-dehydrorhamnose 3,5-epimerase